MKDLNQRASDYFKSNPGTTELFGTSDGTLFLQKQHATNHAPSLEDNEVITLTPESVAGKKMISRAVTQEDLDLNPELAESGVAVGDEIEFEAPTAKELKASKAKAPAAPKTAAPAKAKAAPKAKAATKAKATTKTEVKPEEVKTPTEGDQVTNENPQ